MSQNKFLFTAAAVLIGILTGCGGGGGGGASSLNEATNATVAAQVADITPNNDTDTVSVFVALDGSNTVSGISSIILSADEQRIQSQKNFLSALQSSTSSALVASSGSTCTSTDLATRINQAHTPSSGNVVRIDLNACELALLSKLKGVASIYPDVPMSTQSISSDTVSNINSTVKLSFNGVTAQPTINGHTADGTGQVIALMDSGVEARHPALGISKILQGACFSTASNGGQGFCPNGQNIDTTSPSAGVSCAENWNGTRTEAIQAGCGHGTGMAAAASMNYSVSNINAKGVSPNAQILPVQVFNQTTTSAGKSITSSAGDLLAAIEWVTSEAQRRRSANLPPIVAMNLSLGGGSYIAACDSDYVGSLFKTAFTNLRAQGVLPVVAAGNGGTKNAISFPACVSNTISVAAAKLSYNGLASYSNFNSQTKVLAIGGDVDGTGRYSLPVLCPTAGSYDCWQEVAGTSPATALTSAGVAALFSVKANAALADVENALTTDIAALNLSGSSAMHLTVNGNQIPALRLTASAYHLLGLAESGGSASNTSSGIVTSTSITQAQICVYSQPNFLGSKACATQAYGSNASAENKDIFYRFLGKVGSIRITDIQGTTDLPANTASVSIYPSLAYSSQSGTVNASNTDTTKLISPFINPTIRMIRIQTQ